MAITNALLRQRAPSDPWFREQPVRWRRLRSTSLERARIAVPLDWQSDTPDRSVSIAVVRHRATEKRQGAILVNPGGPGLSGLTFVRDHLADAAGSRLLKHFDIIGFDPRGVGRSEPVWSGLPRREADSPPLRWGSQEWIQRRISEAERYAARCRRYSGRVLPHVGTANAARDLDIIRSVLGEERLNYLGFSYGGLLGATFADLFPHRVGRMVLDSPSPPDRFTKASILALVRGIEISLSSFVSAEPDNDDDPIPAIWAEESSTKDRLTAIADLFERLEAHPLVVSKRRRIEIIDLAIHLPALLGGPRREFRKLLHALQTLDAQAVASILDDQDDSGVIDSYDNSEDAIFAINSADFHNPPNLAALLGLGAEVDAVAPMFGRYVVWSTGIIEGSVWPFPAQSRQGPLIATGSAPILVTGQTRDPSVPLAWVEEVASGLSNSVLYTVEGDAHTSYLFGDDELDSVVEEYFCTGALPSARSAGE